MAASDRTVRCSDCGLELLDDDDDRQPCPRCGSTKQHVLIHWVEPVKVSDSLTWLSRKQYYESNPRVHVAVIAITAGSPFLGLVVAGWLGVVIGLALGATAYLLGPWAVTKVIEIEREQ